LIQRDRRDEAANVLREGFAVAEERGDNMPRDEIAKLLAQIGAPVPESKQAGKADGGPGAFHCQRPGCMWGSRARQLPAPPINDEIGRRIQAEICAECWQEWLRNYSVKVINELRLDLSTEHGQDEYDKYMRGFFGFEYTYSSRACVSRRVNLFGSESNTGFIDFQRGARHDRPGIPCALRLLRRGRRVPLSRDA